MAPFENWKPCILKWENDYYSVPGTLIKKVRPLYFLQLLKLKIIKWSYFFTKRLLCWVMAIFSFQYASVLIFKVFQCPYFPPALGIETLRHIICLEINIEEILACFLIHFEVSHVSADISKKMGQKSYSDCTLILKHF